MMTPKECHKYRCFMLGIRDPETVEELWRDWQKAHADDGRKRRRGK